MYSLRRQNSEQAINQINNLKRKDQLKTKEDVPVSEAFELYMLKHFHNIKLGLLTSCIVYGILSDETTSSPSFNDPYVGNCKACGAKAPLHVLTFKKFPNELRN